MSLINLFHEFVFVRARSEELISELGAQIHTCVQGGGEKGIARHVKLNKKVNKV